MKDIKNLICINIHHALDWFIERETERGRHMVYFGWDRTNIWSSVYSHYQYIYLYAHEFLCMRVCVTTK